MSSNLEELKKEIRGKIDSELLLAEVTFENASYLNIGGYNKRPRSEQLSIREKMRPSEVKGFMRWWYRVIQACSKECLEKILENTCKNKHEKREECIKEELKNYDNVDKYCVSNILGGTNSQSLIRLEVTTKENEEVKMNSDENIFNKLHKHLKIKIENGYAPHQLSSTIKIYLSRKVNITLDIANKILLAIVALLLALIFEGIGASSSRGFAGVKITSFKLSKDSILQLVQEKEIEEKMKKIESFAESIMQATTVNEIDKAINDLLNSQIFGLINSECAQETSIPIIPELSSQFFKYKVIEVPNNCDVIRLLKAIDDAVHVEPRLKVFLGSDKERKLTKKSAIRITVFESIQSKKFLIVHGFLFSSSQQDISQDRFDEAFNQVTKNLCNSIKQECGGTR